MDLVVHGQSKLFRGRNEPMTCGTAAHTIEKCGFTKPVPSNTKRTGSVHTGPQKTLEPERGSEVANCDCARQKITRAAENVPKHKKNLSGEIFDAKNMNDSSQRNEFHHELKAWHLELLLFDTE